MNPYKVIFCLRGGLGGVDVFASNLIEGLLQIGVEAKIILTTRARQFLPDHLQIDELPVEKQEAWPSKWRKMIRYLESQGPCVFLPNYEHNYSVISPKLSKNILTVGIVHSDEHVYYDDAFRMGKFWNGIVTPSCFIADHVLAMDSSVSDRLRVIPYGVPLTGNVSDRTSQKTSPLKIVYVGRLATLQKRILDLPAIFAKLNGRIDFQVTVIGDGPQRAELVKQCESLLPGDHFRFLGVLKNAQALEELPKQDVILLTSDFEGLPIAILEGMGSGCVPVVSSVRSGIPELIEDGINGFVVNIGDIDAFVNRLYQLHQNRPLLSTMSLRAQETIRKKYTVQRMTEDYLNFFQELRSQTESGLYRRPKGKIIPPPDLKISWKQYLPETIRSAGLYGRRVLRGK